MVHLELCMLSMMLFSCRAGLSAGGWRGIKLLLLLCRTLCWWLAWYCSAVAVVQDFLLVAGVVLSCC